MANAAADRKLRQALERHRWEEVLAALVKGANPNTKAPDGTYALASACWYLKIDVVRELLARGANPNIARGEPLESTVSTTSGDARAVLQQLLDHGVKLDLRHARYKNATAVAVAIETGHPQLAEMLVKAGADLTIKDDDGRTPVKVAKEHGYRKLLELMTGRRSRGKHPAIDPFVEATYVGKIARGQAPHTSGLPDWRKVFKGKHFPGCMNPPVHLLTIDLALISEFPETIRRLGKMPIVSHACECDERDYYEFAIGRDRRLSDLDDYDARGECEPGDYHPSKKATPMRLVRETETWRGCGIVVGGQPNWAQQPIWPSCPTCDDASFFVARLYQYELPPSAPGRGNTLNVFVCGGCRTQCMVRQST